MLKSKKPKTTNQTWMFKSKTFRLVNRLDIPLKSNKQIFSHADGYYLQAIRNPKRVPFSFGPKDLFRPSTKLWFNTVDRVKKRTKLRTNKRIAFMSGCPRFKHLEESRTLSTKENTNALRVKLTKEKAEKKPKILKCSAEDSLKRLRKLPARYKTAATSVKIDEKIRNTFQAIPAPKLLINKKDFEIDKSKNIESQINAKLNPEIFFKSEYVS